MMTQSDIQQLQDQPIEQVAEGLGLSVRHHHALCPFHDDSHPSLSFNVRRNRYRCFVCDAHGGVIDLVMHCLGKDFVSACQWLGATGTKREQLQVITKDNPHHDEPKPDIAYLERLMAHPVLNEAAQGFLFGERKLAPEVIRALGISSISYDCPMSSALHPACFDGPALLIPYRDLDGKLVSVQSRYLGQENRPRFRFPKGSRCHIFNLNGLKDLASGTPVFITEGVTDCLAMLSAGFASIAIPSATLLTLSDRHLLSTWNTEHGTRFHMCPDADTPGEKLFQQLHELLPTLVRHQPPAGFKDVGAYYAHVKMLNC